MKLIRFSPKRRSCLLCFWILITIIILYIEYFSYILNTFNWHTLKCTDRLKCQRILLVADPQIIGNKNEPLHFLTPITIFDSDRYLQISYQLAFDFVEPDIVIFLGDLMDEGHVASDREFNNYIRRLFNVFLIHTDTAMYVKHIWLPGDNDIGGEDTVVTQEKVRRFERAFNQPNIFRHHNITFFKINRLTNDIPVYKKRREFYDTSEIFVGLSHVPLMFKPSIFVDKVISKMLPHLLFTAHEHKSMIISTDALLRQDFHIVPVTPDNNQAYEYTLGAREMLEILIPTCSYRMGTDKIGYGHAVIEGDNLKFTVLWSPSRFKQLTIYLILFLIIVIYIVTFCCHKRFCSRSRKIQRHFDYL